MKRKYTLSESALNQRRKAGKVPKPTSATNGAKGGRPRTATPKPSTLRSRKHREKKV